MNFSRREGSAKKYAMVSDEDGTDEKTTSTAVTDNLEHGVQHQPKPELHKLEMGDKDGQGEESDTGNSEGLGLEFVNSVDLYYLEKVQM